MMPIFVRSLAVRVVACVVALNSWAIAADDTVDFNRDVRPILSDKCFACHGFDEGAREADLRLDNREGAIADLGGHAAIVPGDPKASELITRVTDRDLDTVMPPPDSHKKPLEPKDIDLLTRWIQQGAEWGKHWSFVPPVKQEVANGIHPIDYFVTLRLKATKAAPNEIAPRAAAATLARRLSFDLLGLPPDLEDVDRLVADSSPESIGDYVERLLKSPHYGERMAMWWLDGARYSDTDGFQQDGTRTNWPWRDWVIDAFNNNMPFDQFTIEQFAGDLLPDATAEQQLATCFHRNHMNNGEGGRDPEESRVDYVLDRVNTMGTLLLGLTLGCTQCHDHKFDPISQQDYYSLTAYFNSIDETGAAGSRAGPYMKYKSPYAAHAVEEANVLLDEANQQLATVRSQAETEAVAWIAQQIEQLRSGFEPWATVLPNSLHSVEGYQLACDAEGVITSSKTAKPQDDFIITAQRPSLTRVTGVRLEVFPHESHTDGKYSFSKSGEFILTNFKLRVRQTGSSLYREVKVERAVADVEGQGEDTKYGKVVGTLDDDPRTGWTTRTKPDSVTHVAVFELSEPLHLGADEELDIILMQRSLAPRELMGRFRLSLTDQRGPALRSLGEMPLERLAQAVSALSDSFKPEDIPQDLRGKLIEQFLEDHSAWQSAKARRDRVQAQASAAKKAAGDVNVMVLKRRDKERTTFVLLRGVWDQHGAEVRPAVLPAVADREPDDVPSRLELGRWVASKENPLTARVTTNQIWQLFFGAGLVRTPSDFGAQGELPTHPDLLDWLAVDFMEHGWDVKHLVRTIVTSATYQQDSSVSPELLFKDPENRWIARGARFRLPSWMIRDAALKASGLLNPAIGGPPVFPYQPPGIWNDQFMGRFTYVPSVGPAQNRRTIYAFWRRASAPTFLFDSAMRRTCEVAVRRTNTPLQALTLLNNTTALEAARTLADLAMTLETPEGTSRIQFLSKQVLSRESTTEENKILSMKYDAAVEYYRNAPEALTNLVSVGQLDTPNNPSPELAACMLVANLLMNLDEAITHE